jgi:hypothetical protein
MLPATDAAVAAADQHVARLRWVAAGDSCLGGPSLLTTLALSYARLVHLVVPAAEPPYPVPLDRGEVVIARHVGRRRPGVTGTEYLDITAPSCVGRALACETV